MRPHIGALAGCAVLLVLSGCAHDLVLGDAKPSDTRIGRPAQLAAVTPQDWPDACELLTDDEIAALLPEHQGVERTPSPVTILDTDFLDGQDLGGEAAHGSCDFAADHGNGDYVRITITIDAVGSPGDVLARYVAERNDELERKTEYDVVKDVEGTGARACFRSATNIFSSLSCHHRWLAFEVSAAGIGEVPDVPDEETDQALADRLVPEVVRTVAAKVR
ncbi:MAG: hypothetical protein ACRDO4_05325 [Nocardioides sp.]